MKGIISEQDGRRVTNLDEALKLLKDEPGAWRPIAGGTDLMVLLSSGSLGPTKFLDLSALHELRGIREGGGTIRIGALATFAEIRAHAVISKYFPMLRDAAAGIGAIAIQNRATIGGNIANASPAADSSPVLLAYDAEIELVSSSGRRKIKYADFHQGYKKTALKSDELIAAILLPEKLGQEWKQFYRKIGTRKAQAISKISFAAALELKSGKVNSVRIALGSMGPAVLRCTKTENLLSGEKLSDSIIQQSLKTMNSELSPISDIRSTAEYRAQVAVNLLEEFLSQVASS